MHRRNALRAAACFAAVICAAAVPATAYAAGTITITFAGNPSSNEPAVLQIDANASTPINSLTASLLSAPGGTDELDIPNSAFTFAQGSLTNGIWTATLPAGAVPAGTYTVSVTATDTGGDTATNADAGTFGFLYQPTLTANPNVTAVSYGSQSVTFSGSLTAVPPGGGTAIDEGGIPIFYETIGQVTGKLLTDTLSDGTFQATVPNLLGGTYVLYANATATMAAGQSNQISINDNFATTNITAKITPGRVKYGAHVTLSGVATFEVAGSTTSQPLGNYNVDIMDGTTSLPSVETNAAGKYTATVPTKDGNNITVTTGTGNFLLDQSSNTATVTVQLPFSAQSFTAKLEPLGTVHSTVCVKDNAAAYGSPNINRVELQYAARSHGPWKKLGWLMFNSSGTSASCTRAHGEFLTDDFTSGGEYEKTGVIGAQLASAYYRVTYGGTASVQPFHSKAVHSSLALTRFTGFSVSPTSITSGGSIQVSGTLWKHARSWTKYAHRRIGIFFYDRAQGLNILATTRTNGSGHFSKSIRLGGSGSADMLAVYPGDKTHLWCGSNKIRFRVAAARRAGLSRLRLIGGAPRTAGPGIALPGFVLAP
jgi:hypothetical protein